MLYNIFPNNDIELNKCIEEASKEYSGFFNIPNDEFSVRVFSMKKEPVRSLQPTPILFP